MARLILIASVGAIFKTMPGAAKKGGNGKCNRMMRLPPKVFSFDLLIMEQQSGGFNLENAVFGIHGSSDDPFLGSSGYCSEMMLLEWS